MTPLKMTIALFFVALVFVSCSKDRDSDQSCRAPAETGEYHGRYASHYNLSTNILTTIVQFFDGKEGEGANSTLLPAGQSPRVNDRPMHAASDLYDKEFYAVGAYYILQEQIPLASSYLISWTRPDGTAVLNNVFFPDPYSQVSVSGGSSVSEYRFQSPTALAAGHECFGGYVNSRMDAGSPAP